MIILWGQTKGIGGDSLAWNSNNFYSLIILVLSCGGGTQASYSVAESQVINKYKASGNKQFT